MWRFILCGGVSRPGIDGVLEFGVLGQSHHLLHRGVEPATVDERAPYSNAYASFLELSHIGGASGEDDPRAYGVLGRGRLGAFAAPAGGTSAPGKSPGPPPASRRRAHVIPVV